MSLRVGARWDDSSQNDRFAKAMDLGLVDYIEVNFPISAAEDPSKLGAPLYAHTSNNPLSSVYGIDYVLAQQVRDCADAAGSPWIGEHLSWLSPAATGALGYVINPLLTPEFEAVSVKNATELRSYYDRPMALEFGPIYWESNHYSSELEFLNSVATKSDCLVILDIAHWLVGIRNAGRPQYWGLDELDPDRVIELHVAGTRRGNDGYWHDAHGLRPDPETIETLQRCVDLFPKLEAITLEHDLAAPESEFLDCLKQLRAVLGL